MERLDDTYMRTVPEDDDDDDWGSDFERELCSQEIEDNKINEVREATLLQNPPDNFQEYDNDDSQTMQTTIGNRCVNAIKTGAIPKSGFSYLINTVSTDGNKVFKTSRKVSENNIDTQRQVSTPVSQSSNTAVDSENKERQPHIETNSNNEGIAKKTPKKLKPEAFSFLNQLQQRNDTGNESDISKERKTLAPTAFIQAEELKISKSQEDSNLLLYGESNESINAIPSAPPLENTSSNYEYIKEEPLSEFAFTSDSIVSEINDKPPLPARPPPVFRYSSNTFSRPTSMESSCNLPVSDPLSQFASVNPKLAHSISSPDSGWKTSEVATQDKIFGNKVKNRKSLPICPPKRPLPPLPISDTENVIKINPQESIAKLAISDSREVEARLESATIHAKSSQQGNQVSKYEPPVQPTFAEPALEQLISNPQQRLAQILTTQTNVDSEVLISQKKIASAIASRAIGSRNVSISRFQKREAPELQSCGRPKELGMISRRSLENDEEQTRQVEPEQPPYLEAKEVLTPRRFTDHETLINAMNRPLLPQKAAPIQRSVSCNSLVQGIKDLGFSVWSKPEKKRNSDGIGLTKKPPRTISLQSSSKGKPSEPLHVAIIPKDIPNEANLPHGKSDTSLLEEKSALQEYPWFHDVDAKEGHLRLLSVGQDGTFLIRPSSRPTEDIQNTMCILYNGRVRNLHVRITEDGRYALGSKTSKTFSSITEIIRHHKENPVEILPQDSTQLKPQLYRILLRQTPPKLKKLFV